MGAMGEAEAVASANIEAVEPVAVNSKIDWGELVRKCVQSPYFLPTLLIAGALTVIFWNLLSSLYTLWTSDDGYYTHGFLVPLISGYLIYKSYPRLKAAPIRPAMWAAILLIPVLWLAYVARMAQMMSIFSVSFVLTLLVAAVFLFGSKWAKILAAPILYLLFALPVWSGFVNNYTNPLQAISTKVAYKILDLFGTPYMSDYNKTDILFGSYWLNVGVPCSGLKLVLAITAFTCFFVLVGGLKWWGNLVMFALIIPLCLFINGLRIALIGMVGNAYGTQAGAQFHDYSGYITLVVCFFILFKVARLLGWKD